MEKQNLKLDINVRGFNPEMEKRYIYQIEEDIKNIFFNTDKKNKLFHYSNFKGFLIELKQYMPFITTEYLFNMIKADNRSKERSNKEISKRLFVLMDRNGIKKEIIQTYHKTTEIISRELILPIYEKQVLTTKKNLYPTITEKEFKGYSEEFIFKGNHKVNVGIEIKPLISEQIHKLIL